MVVLRKIIRGCGARAPVAAGSFIRRITTKRADISTEPLGNGAVATT